MSASSGNDNGNDNMPTTPITPTAPITPERALELLEHAPTETKQMVEALIAGLLEAVEGKAGRARGYPMRLADAWSAGHRRASGGGLRERRVRWLVQEAVEATAQAHYQASLWRGDERDFGKLQAAHSAALLAAAALHCLIVERRKK